MVGSVGGIVDGGSVDKITEIYSQAKNIDGFLHRLMIYAAFRRMKSSQSIADIFSSNQNNLPVPNYAPGRREAQ